MISISKTLNNQVTLTGETSPEFPLVKIDFDNNINKVLTEKEAKELASKQNSFFNAMAALKTKLMMRFFPKAFLNKLINSGQRPYKPTGKDKNLG